MKKKYVKPQIVIENFSLSTTIAGDCEVKTSTAGSGECGVDFSGITIFLDSIADCSFKVISSGGDGEYNGLCYHVPIEKNNLFNS